MTQLDEHYQLNLLAFLARGHTGDDIQVTVHSDYYQKLYNITRNGTFIARGATFDQSRHLLLPLVSPKIVNNADRATRKKEN